MEIYKNLGSINAERDVQKYFDSTSSKDTIVITIEIKT